ncbi:hypothetical protein Tsubulata_015566, partial [Turnera subulata]
GIEGEHVKTDEGDRLFSEDLRRKNSFAAMLTGRSVEEDMADADQDDSFSVTSDTDDEEDDDPFCPTIQLISSDKKRIYKRWKDTLIVKLLGKRPIKFDEVTLRSSRVKFARVCVEVDLTKPLVSKFCLKRRIWRVVYKGLSIVCFMCGRYGHTLDNCSFNPQPTVDVETGER